MPFASPGVACSGAQEGHTTPPVMRELYHRTSAANAANIGAHGFPRELRAFVWLTDRILGPRDGAHGDAVLVVTMPADLNLGRFELREPGKAYRQWLVPGAWLNNRVWTHVIKPPADSEPGST